MCHMNEMRMSRVGEAAAFSGVRIREAAVEDAVRLLEIYAYYVEKTAITFEYDVRIRHIKERYPYLVIERNGVIEGYAYAGVFKDRAAYDRSCEMTIYLDRGAVGGGLGRKLYEALEEALKAQGMLNLYACIGYPDVPDEYLDYNSAQFRSSTNIWDTERSALSISADTNSDGGTA